MIQNLKPTARKGIDLPTEDLAHLLLAIDHELNEALQRIGRY